MMNFLRALTTALLLGAAVGLPDLPIQVTEIDPEIYYDAQDFVTKYGYPFEKHHPITADGYILEVHRIPHGLNNSAEIDKPVVFLQHGLVMSSDDWVINAPSKSFGKLNWPFPHLIGIQLAFILADAGYDVWLGNSRGNKYSRRSTKYDARSNQFWKFSFDEMAKYDIPAMLDYVYTKTGSKVYYVGHSQGTLVGFSHFSEDPDWTASRIHQFHALAPIAYLRSVTTALKYIAPMTLPLGSVLFLIGYNEFAPSNALIQWVASRVCGSSYTTSICSQVIFQIAGYEAENIDKERLQIYVAHAPAGTSSMNIVQFGQLINSRKLQKYDNGYLGNFAIYRRFTPPEYPVANLAIPTFLYWGDKDKLATGPDVADLVVDIGHTVVADHRIVGAGHLDFVWGTNAPRDIYPLVMKHIAADVASKKINNILRLDTD